MAGGGVCLVITNQMKKSVAIPIIFSLFVTGVFAQTRERIQALVHANDTFAFRLYSNLTDTEGNIIVSPFSISMALGMTSAGASGTTLTQIRELLAVRQEERAFHEAFYEVRRSIGTSLRKGGATLRLLNGIWFQSGYDFRPFFPQALRAYYGAHALETDFLNRPTAAVGEINAWVRRGTRGRVGSMIDPRHVTPETAFMLINAVYFRGQWHSEFKRGSTREEPFLVTSGQRVTVPMMFQKNEFRIAVHDVVTILSLPYVDGRFSMVLFLPAEADGLSDLEGLLDVEQVNRWLRQLRTAEVKVFLPRFSFDCTVPLRERLSRMGMANAFAPEAAEFSRISTHRPLWLGSVMHHAGIEVDEEGTEAWAGTAVSGVFGEPPPPEIFRADHPFFFIITENSTGSILFMGRVVDPTQNGIGPGIAEQGSEPDF